MTKLEVKIKNPKIISEFDKKDGAYLATFDEPDDRILIYCLGEIREAIDVKGDSDGNLHLQPVSTAHYYNLKKIKKLIIEVELE